MPQDSESVDSESQPASMIKVQFGGAEFEVPKELGDALISERSTLKDQIRNMSDQLGGITAEKEAANKKAEGEAQRAREAEMMKNGEVEKVREMMKADYLKREQMIAGNMKRMKLREIVSRDPGILKDAIDDVVMLAYDSVQYDIETDALYAVQDGKPRVGSDGLSQGAEVLVGEVLSKRPYFRNARVSPGTGATETGGKAVTQITRAQYDSNPAKYGAALESKTVTLID